MAGIALNYGNCSVAPSGASLAIDCTGQCSTVSLWCSASCSYAPFLNCAPPEGTLFDDRLVAGGSWTFSENGSTGTLLIYGAPQCVTAKIGSQGQTPAYYYGSLLNNAFNVTSFNLETLVGTLDPTTMTITGTDIYGPYPIQQVPFVAVKVP
jgi:hypothetical protein